MSALSPPPARAPTKIFLQRGGQGLEEIDGPCLHGLDRGALYGASAFETMRACQGRVHNLRAHLNRLAVGVGFLGLSGAPALEPRLLEDAAQEALDKSGYLDAVVRLSVSPGQAAGSGLSGGLLARSQPTVLWMVRPFEGLTSAQYRQGQTAMLSRWRRPEPQSLPSEAKLGAAYTTSLLARAEAEAAGADEAILCDPRGLLACASAANLFWIREGALWTPALECSVLPGTTRAWVLDQVPALLGAEVREVQARPEALEEAEELFMTASVFGIMALRLKQEREEEEEESPREGPRTRRLREAWLASLPGGSSGLSPS